VKPSNSSGATTHHRRCTAPHLIFWWRLAGSKRMRYSTSSGGRRCRRRALVASMGGRWSCTQAKGMGEGGGGSAAAGGHRGAAQATQLGRPCRPSPRTLWRHGAQSVAGCHGLQHASSSPCPTPAAGSQKWSRAPSARPARPQPSSRRRSGCAAWATQTARASPRAGGPRTSRCCEGRAIGRRVQ